MSEKKDSKNNPPFELIWNTILRDILKKIDSHEERTQCTLVMTKTPLVASTGPIGILQQASMAGWFANDG